MFCKRNIVAFIVISVLGTLGHFVYEWTGENYLLGLIFPVSESVWEHLKLLFYPTVIYSAIEFFTLKEKKENYIPAVAISLFYGMFCIVAIYYIYTGVIGRNIDFINIAIFFIGVLISIIKKNNILKSEKYSLNIFTFFFLFIGIIFVVSFAVWSYNPPSLGIFMQPMPV